MQKNMNGDEKVVPQRTLARVMNYSSGLMTIPTFANAISLGPHSATVGLDCVGKVHQHCRHGVMFVRPLACLLQLSLAGQVLPVCLNTRTPEKESRFS